MVYERMLAESRRLETQIDELKKQLKKFPEGKLFCTQNGKYHKWYLTDGETQTYLPKKKRKFAEKLAMKKYLTLRLEDAENEKRAIEFYLRHHKKDNSQAEKLFYLPAYNELISPYFVPTSKEYQQWAVAPYEKNPKYPEQLIYKAASGTYVRSKSEVMIDMYLHMNKIPFRYEAALHMGEVTFYPDFTILHPKTGKMFFWEHFGLVDESSYCQNMLSKLQIYISFGIIPTQQLITTYETKEQPLNPEIVEQLIQYYFV